MVSSTKWGLGENFVLRLMECLTATFSFDVFTDNYFTFFVCFPTLEITTFEQQVCSAKIGYANAVSLGTSSCKKKKKATLNSTHRAKKQSNFNSGWLEQHQGGLYSLF